MSQTTVPLNFKRCSVCGRVAHTDDVVCSQCGALLPEYTPPPEDTFQAELSRVDLYENVQPTTRLVLQFLPADTCLSLPLQDFLILGRVIPPGPPEVLDLTSFEGQDLGVSRRHCILKRRYQELYVIDLNAPNGTFLNGQRLEPQREHLVRHGDELKLGRMLIRVYFDTGG